MAKRTPTPAEIAPPVIQPNASLPAVVVLASPYGFYDDENVLHHWHTGTAVTDPAEIALLIERKAPLQG